MWVVGGGAKDDVWSSNDGITWTEVSASAGFGGRSDHSSVVYDNKMWVMGGTKVTANPIPSETPYDDVWYSSDGVTWTEATDTAAFGYRSCHSNVVFDGKMWLLGGEEFVNMFSHQTMNDSWYSTDGINWTQAGVDITTNGITNHGSAVYNNKMWMIGSSSVWESPDGIIWHEKVGSSTGIAINDDHSCVVYDSKLWSIGGFDRHGYDTNEVFSSDDGTNWYKRDGEAEYIKRASHQCVEFNNQLWIIGGGKGDYQSGTLDFHNDVWQSDDGLNWDRVTGSAPFGARVSHRVVTFNNKLWLIGGVGNDNVYYNDVWSSSNGVEWVNEIEHAAFSARADFSCCVYNSKIWLFAGIDESGARADVWSSSNGVNWVKEADTTSISLRSGHESFVFDNKMWVVGGVKNTDPLMANDVWNSVDGINWVEVTDSAAFIGRYLFSSSVFDGKMWVVGGLHDTGDTYANPMVYCLNDVWSSSDGATWTQATTSSPFGTRCDHTCTAFNNRLWLINGQDISPGLHQSQYDDIWSTADGESWEHHRGLATFSDRLGGSSEVFNGELVIVGGYNFQGSFGGDVWSSSNGATWSKKADGIAPGFRYHHSTAVCDNKLWVIGGSGVSEYYHDVWYSEDAVNWTEATASADFGVRRGHASIGFDGKLWVFGGTDYSVDYNDIWSSEDGVNWTEVLTEAPFPERYDQGLVVFDNKMWVIGGYGETARLSDVWYSSDGLNWTEVTNSAAFGLRSEHGCVATDDKLWVIGGSGVDGDLNDVWSSTDGVAWTQVIDEADFPAVGGLYTHVFDGALWVIDEDQSVEGVNNVWYSDLEITLDLSLDALDFNVHDIDAGPTAPLTTVLSNQSDASINVTSVSIQNDSEGNFAVTTSINKASLLAGGSMDINVTFNPSSAGSKTATLVIESDDSQNPTLNVPLTGEAVIDYTVAYTAGANGSIDGTATQLVNHGDNAASVEAVPSSGYDFFDWSDGSTDNPRQDTNVTTNISVTANFVESNTIVDWSLY